MRPPTKREVAQVTAAILVTVSVMLALILPEGDDTETKVITKPVPTKAPQGDLSAPPGPAQERPQDSELRDETPPDVDKQILEEGKTRTTQLGRQLEERPVGGAQNYSCRTDFSGRVWSNYSFKPTMGVLHYTVSPNVSGWGDVNGIVSYFERTRVASADRVVDFEGHCTQMVPITTGKSWTQGAANGATCWSYEIIATGRESRAQWLASPLIRRGILAAMARDDNARCGIPNRRINPVGCVFPVGVTDHNALECGNDHTDVAPNFPWDVFMRQLAGAEKKAPSERAVRLCKTVVRVLRLYREPDPPDPTAYQRRKAKLSRAALNKYNYACGIRNDRMVIYRK